jgi:hypothetical protein
MGIGGHKSPNHFGFMRSISYDGSQQYDYRGPAVPPGLSNNDDNDMISSHSSSNFQQTVTSSIPWMHSHYFNVITLWFPMMR